MEQTTRRHTPFAPFTPLEHLQPANDVTDLRLQREQVVPPRLDPHQQAIEGRDVDAGGVMAALEPLHERRPRAGERIEHASFAGTYRASSTSTSCGMNLPR